MWDREHACHRSSNRYSLSRRANWLMGFDATTLARIAVFAVTPDAYGGGIWQAGARRPWTRPASYAGFAGLTCTEAPAFSSSVPREAISSPGFKSPNTSTSGPDASPVLTSTHSVRPSRTRITNVRPVVLATLPLGTRSDGVMR